MTLASTINFSPTTPAPPSGQQNVTPQNDGGSPTCNQSFYDPLMVGDSGSGGTAGNVPAPGAGDAAAGKFLKADGTWEIPTVSTSITSVRACSERPRRLHRRTRPGHNSRRGHHRDEIRGSHLVSMDRVRWTNLYLVASAGGITASAKCIT